MPVLYRRGLMESTRVTMISPDYISPNPDQPRRYFDPDGLTELAESIRVHGILQPLALNQLPGLQGIVRLLHQVVADTVLTYMNDGVQGRGQAPQLGPLFACQFHMICLLYTSPSPRDS